MMERLLRLLPLMLALLIGTPLALTALNLLHPDPAIWRHLWATRLPDMLIQTTLLVLLVGGGSVLVGGGLAWLVSAYEFPGRTWLRWMLVLPLAMPGFVLGFVFMATFDFAGPVQTWLRSWFGRDVYFPEIRSLGGAALVLTLAWYPYVYLPARAAFAEVSAVTYDAGRALGLGDWQIFVRLILPLARPALIAGTTLVMLETLTDFATVRYFNVLTLSEGIYRVWEGMLDREAALSLGTILLLTALLVIGLERWLRGDARYTQAGAGQQRFRPQRLHGWRALAASGVCLAVLAVAFGLPMLQLLIWAIDELRSATLPVAAGVVWGYIATSVILAGGAALLVSFCALLLAAGTRLGVSRWERGAVRVATLGYAMPGAVVAVGILSLLALLDRSLPQLGINLGILLTGSLIGLFYAYLVRFLAVAYGSADAGLEKVTPRLVEAARSMGAGRGRIIGQIHAPLARAGLLAGATLVFVDVMKELPVTLMLRPFGMDTLAIWTYMLAAESFWQAAAIPALIIVLLGVAPTALLMRVGDRGI